MAKISKGTRQKTIISASKSAYDSLGFFAKELASLTDDSSFHSKSMRESSDRLVELFTKAFEIEPEEKKPSQEELKDTTEKIKKRSFDIAALGLVIPLLINPQAREYLYSFVKGLVGEEAFTKIKYGVTGVLSVLAGVFTYKVFKQVGDTISAMKKLAQVTSILFGITEAATEDTLDKEAELDKEKKKVEEERKKKEADDKKLKDAGKKGIDDVKASKQEYKKAGPLGKIKFLATRFGPKVLGAILKSIPFIGAAVTIGLLVSEIANFFSDDEKEKQESKPESKPSVAASAPPSGQSVSDLPKESPPAAAPQTKPSAAALKPPAESAPVKSSTPSSTAPEARQSVTDADLEKLIRQKNAEYEARDAAIHAESEKKMKAMEAAAPQAISKPSPGGTTVDDYQVTPGGKKLPSGVTRDRNSGAYMIGDKMFFAGTDEAFFAILKAFKSGEKVTFTDDDRNVGRVTVSFDPKSQEREILGPASGSGLNQSSEEVGSMKKKAKNNTVVINNIDNSTILSKSSSPPPNNSGGAPTYSASIGM